MINMISTDNISTFVGGLAPLINKGVSPLIPPRFNRLKKDTASQSQQTHIDDTTPSITATLSHIELETHDTKSYFFTSEKPLEHNKAGAHIHIQFDAYGQSINRTYTLSSSPALNFNAHKKTAFSITVKRVKGGLASNWLFENMKLGGQVRVSQPQGSFVLPYQPAGKLLMLSAGSGVTPLMSMLRYLTQTGNLSNIHFLHYAQSDDDIIFYDELQKLTTTNSNINTHFSVEELKNKKHKFHQGRINLEQLIAIVPDLLEHEIYLCGPQPFMKAAIEILDDIAFKPSQLHLENFTADRSAITQLGYSTELHFSSLDQPILSNPSKTILEEAEAAGLKPASACRIGICKSCRCKKISGTTVNLITNEESNTDNEYILPCVSVAKTVTTVEL